jgi:hypothetical protein
MDPIETLNKQIACRGTRSGKLQWEPQRSARRQLNAPGDGERRGSGRMHDSLQHARDMVEQRIDDDLSHVKRAWKREATRLATRAAKSTTIGSDLARPFAELVEEG